MNPKKGAFQPHENVPEGGVPRRPCRRLKVKKKTLKAKPNWLEKEKRFWRGGKERTGSHSKKAPSHTAL